MCTVTHYNAQLAKTSLLLFLLSISNFYFAIDLIILTSYGKQSVFFFCLYNLA